MTSILSKGWLLVLLLGVAACGTERVVYHQGTIPVDTVMSVAVSPSAVSMQCGQTVQLLAAVTTNTGINRSVLWSSSNAGVAGVDSTGLVHALGIGTATVTATSLADSRKAGSAGIIVATISVPVITTSMVIEAGTGQPANLNAITDSIDVTYNLRDPGCLGGALPWVSLTASISNGQDSLTTTVPVPSSSTSLTQVTVRLNTAAKKADGTPVLHNGSYTLTGVLLGSNGSTYRSANTVTLTVAN